MTPPHKLDFPMRVRVWAGHAASTEHFARRPATSVHLPDTLRTFVAVLKPVNSIATTSGQHFACTYLHGQLLHRCLPPPNPAHTRAGTYSQGGVVTDGVPALFSSYPCLSVTTGRNAGVRKPHNAFA